MAGMYSLVGGGRGRHNKMWDSFIRGFCKVEFLCYAGDPNWLGWMVMAGPVLIPVLLIVLVFVYWVAS